MSAVYLGDWPAGSPEWHHARRNGLGGSEIAAVLGLSPYESRFTLHHRKAGLAGPQEENSEMEWGKRLEPVIADKFADEHPDRPLHRTGVWCHPERPWQICSPDRFIGDPEHPDDLLEIKTARVDVGWGPDGSDEVPPHIRVQCLWQADTFDLPRTLVAVLIGGCDYREYVIERDEAECAQLRAAAVEFLDGIAEGQLPDIDAHSATYVLIRELHPDIDPVEVPLPTDLAVAYVAAYSASKSAKESLAEATSRVADAMGTAQRATWDGHTIATRQARQGGLPYVVVGRKLPDLDDLTTPSPTETEAAA